MRAPLGRRAGGNVHRCDDDQGTLALWAADCAERVLVRYEDECPHDPRPRLAVEAARAWARGEMRVGEARAAALGAHRAAREAEGAAAIAAARAAGHAAATAHVPRHALHAAAYSVKAVAAGEPRAAAAERTWQEQRLRGGIESVPRVMREC